MNHPYTDPGLASPDWADGPEPCPECGSADAEYLPHEPGCPSGYPTRETEIHDHETHGGTRKWMRHEHVGGSVGHVHG